MKVGFVPKRFLKNTSRMVRSKVIVIIPVFHSLWYDVTLSKSFEITSITLDKLCKFENEICIFIYMN